MEQIQKYVLRDSDLLFTSNKSKQYILKIRDLPTDDRPREKMLEHGPTILSTSELLAVILGTGTKTEGVLEMSARIMKEYGEKSIISEVNANTLSKNLDIPITKACQIVACGELGRRFYKRQEGGLATIRNANDVYEYLKDMRSLPKEQLRGIYLNTHNKVIHDEVISMGTINSNIVHPREVFRPAIEYGAVAMILAHNHPSGVASPSDKDLEITEQLIKAGKIIGIHLLDHVIVAKEGFISINAKYDD
ncbi:MAG: DNA repair protein RadC [bacterium]|nr:DNA repair protein RadC [bacterium]